MKRQGREKQPEKQRYRRSSVLLKIKSEKLSKARYKLIPKCTFHYFCHKVMPWLQHFQSQRLSVNVLTGRTYPSGHRFAARNWFKPLFLTGKHLTLTYSLIY